MPDRRGAGNEWTKLSKRRIALGRAMNEPCCLCGGEINYMAAGNTPFGPTSEHLKPVAFGGELVPPIEDLGVAHRRCQDRQGGRIRAMKAPPVIAPRPVRDTSLRPSIGVPVQQIHNERAQLGELPEPHYFSAKHPSAVGSMGPEWMQWLEVNLNFRLRPWQQLVFNRALEVDSDGKFVWRDILVTTPRQSGKSFLVWAVCLARAAHSEHFTEPQECLHIANNLAAARRIHQRAWRWGKSEGLKIYRAFGQERLVWPDGSHWSIAASSAIWGWSVGQAVVDEAWNVEIDIVDSALKPTLVEREQPQLYMFSTANENSTSLFTTYRDRAIAEVPNTMIAEWSAPYDSDYKDPAVWQMASPHWSQQRKEVIESSLHADHFREQWLNIWPRVNPQAEWAERWAMLPLGTASGSLVGAMEVAFDRSCYGVAVASTDGSVTAVTAAVVSSEAQALEWMRQRGPISVVVGANMAERFIGPWQIMPGTARTTAQSTPWFAAAIRNSGLAHNHDPQVGQQVKNAVITGYETGPVLTARKSKGPIPVVKAIAWAAAASAEDWFGLAAGASIY